MHIGPKLQRALATILMQWRQYYYVFIAKMYRQTLVDSRDTNYQSIVWQPTPGGSLTDYRLLIVTYGTATVLFLALRVLNQLVDDESAEFSAEFARGSRFTVLISTYVDDCAFGADDQILVRQTCDQLIELLKKGGFRFRKWASNYPSSIPRIMV